MPRPLFSDTAEAINAARHAFNSGTLPPRYLLPEQPWVTKMRQLAEDLPPGSRVLDVGAGAAPSIAMEQRPPGTLYVGLDVDEHELSKAPIGAYDEILVGEIANPPEHEAERYDLVLCYRTLEHVSSLAVALEAARRYLRPGGRFLAQTSGRYAGFALANRIVPSRMSPRLLERLTPRIADTVFPAQYDRCWYTAIERLLAPWGSFRIEPLYYGAGYVLFSRLLLSAYLVYEEFVFRRRTVNLATHYIIEATN